MKYIFLFCLFGLSQLLPIHAQNYQINWGEVESSGAEVIDILPLSGNEFLTIRQAKNILTVVLHRNFLETATGKISTKIRGNVALYEGVKIVGNELAVFLSDRREGQDLFFMQKYNQQLKISGEAKKLASYDLERGYDRGNYDVITSQNNAYFAVIWNVPGKNNNRDKYGFKVFDKELNEVSEGDYKLPFEGKLSTINEHYLSNTGDYFISVTEYVASDNKKIFKDNLNYKALHVFHVSSELTDQYTVDLKGKRIESMTMNSDNTRLFTLSGVYGEQGQVGVSGLFYIRFNFGKNEIMNQGFEPFDKSFITQDWTNREKEQAEKQQVKGNGLPQLYNYKMRQSEVLEDGSIVGSMEQYFVVTNSYFDGRGNARNVFSYFYNDIIAFKIGKEGGFDWLKKIDKQQESTNDGGPFSSYSRFVDGAKIVFIFNDNMNNYGADGNYLNPQGSALYQATFGQRNNLVALVTIDVNDGSVERRTFLNRAEAETMLVPKLFQVNYQQKEVLLYGVNRRNERFGLLRIGEE